MDGILQRRDEHGCELPESSLMMLGQASNNIHEATTLFGFLENCVGLISRTRSQFRSRIDQHNYRYFWPGILKRADNEGRIRSVVVQIDNDCIYGLLFEPQHTFMTAA